MTEAEAVDIALNLLYEHDVLVNFELSNEKSYVAQCTFINNIAHTIKLSKRFIPYLTPETLREAILHEIAHVNAGPAHDEAWEAECAYYGIPARLAVPLLPGAIRETSRWLLACDECGQESFRDRLSPRLAYYCGKCHVEYTILRNPYLIPR